jgi:hypothetical protein
MPHRLFDWRVRVKAAGREYQAVRIALDLLGEASDDQIHDIAEARGWNDLAAAEVYAAGNNLDATYIIRMYSAFERAVGSYWREIPGHSARAIEGDELLDEVGAARLIDEAIVRCAQEVRRHRNSLVHGSIDVYARNMALEGASRDLLKYLDRLPATWG